MVKLGAYLLVIISIIISHCYSAPVVSTITKQQYDTIQIGWAQNQVTQLLGGNGSVVSATGQPGTSSYYLTVSYTGAQSSLSAATFVFRGGKLFSKAQVGLDTGIYTITKQQFDTIQIGWTRDQVTKLVGSPGNAVAVAGTGTAQSLIIQYTGAGTPYALATLGFVGGSLVSKFQVGFDPVVKGKITKQQFDTTPIGWTQNQVTQLLGGNGSVVSATGQPGTSLYYLTVSYTGAQSSLSAATFVFSGGKLFSKAQVGLDTGIYTITKQQFDTIQIRWTRDQVTKLVGSPGNVVAVAGMGSFESISVQYTKAGTPYALATLTFVGGSLSNKYQFGLQ